MYCVFTDGCAPNRVSLWVPFQNSASSVTTMYKGMFTSDIQSCIYLYQNKVLLYCIVCKKKHLNTSENTSSNSTIAQQFSHVLSVGLEKQDF